MKTFSEALKEAVKDRNPSLRSVADAAGVSYDQLKKVVQGKTGNTNIEDARRIALYFGKSVEEFIDCPEMSEHIETAQLLSQLDKTELEILVDVAKARISARDQSQK